MKLSSLTVQELMPLHFKVVAVADPRKFARTKLGKQHNIGGENLFEGLHKIRHIVILALMNSLL